MTTKVKTTPAATPTKVADLCPQCKTQTIIAPGIGPYCPNRDCPVADRLDGSAPAVLKSPDSLVQQLGEALQEAMEWNWLEENAEQEIPADVWVKCKGALKAAKDAGLFKAP